VADPYRSPFLTLYTYVNNFAAGGSKFNPRAPELSGPVDVALRASTILLIEEHAIDSLTIYGVDEPLEANAYYKVVLSTGRLVFDGTLLEGPEFYAFGAVARVVCEAALGSGDFARAT